MKLPGVVGKIMVKPGQNNIAAIKGRNYRTEYITNTLVRRIHDKNVRPSLKSMICSQWRIKGFIEAFTVQLLHRALKGEIIGRKPAHQADAFGLIRRFAVAVILLISPFSRINQAIVIAQLER